MVSAMKRKRGRPKAGRNPMETTLSFRVPSALLSRAESIAVEMDLQEPYACRYSRGDHFRRIFIMGLERLEQQQQQAKKEQQT